jgi:hypothetical protein
MAPPVSREWQYKQVLFAEILDELNRHFKVLQVSYMPIKGAYLICSGLAERMPFRRMGDIDILVRKNDFDLVCEYFSKIPQARFLENKWYFEKTFDYSIGDFHCHLEIHWMLNYPARFNLSSEPVFSRGKVKAEFQLLPCPEDALVILVCHTLVHVCYEIRSTLFEEISLISRLRGFNWETFWALAKQTGIMPFFCFIMLCYKNKLRLSTLSVPHKSFYALVLARFIGLHGIIRLPVTARRIVAELPFVKNPYALIMQTGIPVSKEAKKIREKTVNFLI